MKRSLPRVSPCTNPPVPSETAIYACFGEIGSGLHINSLMRSRVKKVIGKVSHSLPCSRSCDNDTRGVNITTLQNRGLYAHTSLSAEVSMHVEHYAARPKLKAASRSASSTMRALSRTVRQARNRYEDPDVATMGRRVVIHCCGHAGSEARPVYAIESRARESRCSWSFHCTPRRGLPFRFHGSFLDANSLRAKTPPFALSYTSCNLGCLLRPGH